MKRLVLLAILFAARTAAAQSSADQGTPSDDHGHGFSDDHVNLRAGFASDSGATPTACLEIRVVWAASIESCGKLASTTADNGIQNIIHFRANIPVLTRRAAGGTFAVRAGAGFAKLEVIDDGFGIHFGDPDPTTRASVDGLEGGASIEWMRPAGHGFEWLANADAGLAWFAGADKLATPEAHAQPFVSLEIGAGW